MSLFRGEKVYDSPEDFFRDYPSDGAEIVINGERRLLSRKPRPEGHDSSGYCRRKFGDVFPVIPRSDWSARIKEQIELRSRISDYCDFKPPDQDGLPTCWAIGTCHGLAIKRRTQRLPFKPISGCSIAVPISGGHSGGYEGEAVAYIVKHGAASTDTWPENDTRRSLNTDPAVVADRLNHKIEGAIEVNGTDEWASACLLTLPGTFAYNWMSHVMTMCDLVEIEKNSFGFRPRNTWGDWGAKNDLGFYGFNTYREGHGTPDSGWIYEQVTNSPI